MKLDLHPGDWITGPFWDGPVQIVALDAREGYDRVTVAMGEHLTRAYVLSPVDRVQVTRVAPADWRALTFDGDPTRFRLAIHAHRLRLAHAIDPYAALNASRIDPLPHQFEAVYEHLLARPVVRALLAHDAGAGKTIMAGMLIKELQRRQGAQRILIVVPAGLKTQWRRELLTKFALDFPIVDRDYIRQQHSDDLLIWRETDLALTSVDFIKQKGLRQALQSVEWNLVIVDEAHKMAAYRRPNGSIRKTGAYELGEVLSRHTVHFLLMTATPHKGDPDNYYLLVRLVDPQWGDAAAYASGSNPLVLRRTKEEMCHPDGSPLYPERIVEPKYYHISRAEGSLLETVQQFAKKHYARIQATNQSAAFALLSLERRLASSPYALRESLQRMREKVQARLNGQRGGRQVGENVEDWATWEDLTEEERWQREARAENTAVNLLSARRLKNELRTLNSLITKAEALLDEEQQEKLVSLREACDVWVGEHNEQLIVFTEFKDTLDYLVGHLEAWGYTTTQIHGDMPQKARRAAEKAFWEGTQILVATEAAGEGINLQCCSVMVNYDIPWNPCRLEQRMGRIHRYGQRASEVHIFNLIAQNTLEGEVQDALLKKLKTMRKDLGDKVFNVVGEVLWRADLRQALEQIALGERAGVEASLGLIEQAEQAVREALEAEQQAAAAEPLDVAAFRRKQATFAAHRLSPEDAEKFFRQAMPLAGGTVAPFEVSAGPKTYSAFDVTLPPDMVDNNRPRVLRVSFWPQVCSDDDAQDDAVFFIAPGHWLFEALLERVMALGAPDLAQGAVYLDLQPEAETPYLVWFSRAGMRDGLDRSVGDLLAAVQHRADQENVVALPTEILDAFAEGQRDTDLDTEIRQGQAMLDAQPVIIDRCVGAQFLPVLAEHRIQQCAALARDREFLARGLDALAEQLTLQALDALANGETETWEQLSDQATAAQDRKTRLLANLDRAGEVLLTAPDILGVALVLPAPLEIEVEGADGLTTVPMRRDDAVEDAAMRVVMAYEREQGRYPKDVHIGNSWDIETYDAQGQLLRYIEVKGRGPADAAVVTMTEPEWDAARRHGDRHWLYIARLGDEMLWLVQDPYGKLEPKELKRWVVRVKDVEEAGERISVRAIASC